MKNLDSVHAYAVADEIYGIENKQQWPGSNYNNLLKYRDLCFDALAGFVDPNDVENFRNSPGGKMCYNANLQQMINSGKTKITNFRYPLTQNRPQLFKNAYLETGDIQKAKHLCHMRVNDVSATDEEAFANSNYCDMDARTMELTLQNEEPRMPTKHMKMFENKPVYPDLWKRDEAHAKRHEQVIKEDYTDDNGNGCSCSNNWGFWITLGIVILDLMLMIVIMTCKRKRKKLKRK